MVIQPWLQFNLITLLFSILDLQFIFCLTLIGLLWSNYCEFLSGYFRSIPTLSWFYPICCFRASLQNRLSVLFWQIEWHSLEDGNKYQIASQSAAVLPKWMRCKMDTRRSSEKFHSLSLNRKMLVWHLMSKVTERLPASCTPS